MDQLIHRAVVLIQQQKYREAEKLLKSIVSDNPTHLEALALLAEVKLQTNDSDTALQVIESALGIAPDFADLFYIRARIFAQKSRLDDAEQDLQHFLTLEPYDADGYAFLASIKLNRKKFDEALNYANKSLEIDADNLLGLNIRSAALVKLNKKDEAYQTIEGALREDPNNAYTHANYGWSLLETGKYKASLEHFREALRNDPNLKYAQAGMVEALKANNIFYRLFLKYAFWMSKLTAKYQWGVIIGFYLGFRLLRGVAENNEALSPFLTPVLVLLGVFAFSTWIISPLSNLFLRFNSYGKYLLDKQEKISSNFVGASLLLSVLSTLGYFIQCDPNLLPIAVFGVAMMLPLGVMLTETRPKNALVYYTTALALVGLLSIANTFLNGELVNQYSVIFLFGFIAFQWVANFMMIKQDNL